MRSIAARIDSALAEAILTVPSSEMSILAPDSATISRITEPPEPITSLILSTGMWMVSMRGAYSPSSGRAVLSALSISPRICMRPSRA